MSVVNFPNPIGSSLSTPHSNPPKANRKWWRRFQVEDEEQAVMKGTISYAMSQARNQHSTNSSNFVRDCEHLNKQTSQTPSDWEQVTAFAVTKSSRCKIQT